ncbi:MAG: glycoside hydrolase family 3 N-terminal domain-containing protein [Thermoanaerobaculia bacterium]
MTSRLFGVGISGPRLTPAERAILDRHPPRGVILFARNIESVEQVAALAGEIRRRGSLLFLDQEGGPVDRLREVLGPSISFFEAARRGLARRAGELAGEGCARLGIGVDLAPVVDRRVENASEVVLRDRCVSADPAEVTRAAKDFLAGLHSRGVGGCVKHFPGLGRATLDTHAVLAVIPRDRRERERDLLPFRRTARRARAVMVSHAAGPGGTPASLSRAAAHRLLRRGLPFDGAAFSDDLEMGALTAHGDLPERCVLSCRAGCDLLFVCSRIEEYPACVEEVERRVPSRRRAEALSRLDRYERHLARLRRAAGPPRLLPLLIAAIAELKSLESKV